jgi:hypothetical protein
LALHEPGRQLELAVVETGLLVDEERVIVALASKRFQLARRDVQESLFPFEAFDELFEVRDAHARDVEPAHRGANARAGKVIHGHTQLFERLQYSDVRAAARAATRQYETDLRPRLRHTDGRRLRERSARHRARQNECARLQPA